MLLSAEFKADKEVVKAACRQNGGALKFARAELKADKEIVMTAAASHPAALKLAKGGLNQDGDCWVAAKVWDNKQTATKHSGARPNIVLSTRFSLQPNSRSQATTFAVLLKDNEYIQNRNLFVYSPNAFAKDTCDPEWTRRSWPCRGTFETCQKEDSFKTGEPQPASCWRYSFDTSWKKPHKPKDVWFNWLNAKNVSAKNSLLEMDKRSRRKWLLTLEPKFFVSTLRERGLMNRSRRHI